MGQYNKLWVALGVVVVMVLLDMTGASSGDIGWTEVLVGVLGAGGIYAAPNRPKDEGPDEGPG